MKKPSYIYIYIIFFCFPFWFVTETAGWLGKTSMKVQMRQIYRISRNYLNHTIQHVFQYSKLSSSMPLCQIRLHHCHRSMPSWPFLSLQEAAVIGAMGYVGWSLGPCQIHIFELNRPNPHFHRLNYLNLHSCWTTVTMGHQGTPVRTATPTPWASALGPCSRAVARWWAAGRPSAASRMWTCAMAAAWVESGNNYIVTMYSCSCLCQSTCLKIL